LDVHCTKVISYGWAAACETLFENITHPQLIIKHVKPLEILQERAKDNNL